MSVVLGHTDLLSQLTAGSPLAVRAEKISNAAERCARIVKNFLALARRHPAERQKVRLNQIIREAVELLAYPLRVDNGQAPAARLRPVILSDLRMPWLDGPGLYKELERIHPALLRRIVFFTEDTVSPESRAFLERTMASAMLLFLFILESGTILVQAWTLV